jgi:hypothetical protein
MTPHTLLLLAQTDPISGGAGWVGAGLLGAVLAWLLLKHLPDKDAQYERMMATKDTQLKDLMDDKDKQIKELLQASTIERDRDRKDRHNGRNDFTAMLGEVQRRGSEAVGDLAADFKQSLATVTAHCEAENTRLLEELRKLYERAGDKKELLKLTGIERKES